MDTHTFLSTLPGPARVHAVTIETPETELALAERYSFSDEDVQLAAADKTRDITASGKPFIRIFHPALASSISSRSPPGSMTSPIRTTPANGAKYHRKGGRSSVGKAETGRASAHAIVLCTFPHSNANQGRPQGQRPIY
jgi:hypothetical protein